MRHLFLFLRFNFNVQLSIDGFSQIHNQIRIGKKRVETYAIILKNLKKLIYKKIKVSLRVNLMNQNIGYLNQFIDEISSIIERKSRCKLLIYCDVVDVETDHPSFLGEPISTMSLLYLYYRLSQLGFNIPSHYSIGGDCIIRDIGSVVVNPNGDLIKCYSFSGKEMTKIGNLNSKYYPYAYLAPICRKKTCEFYTYCKGGCCYVSYIETGILNVSCKKERLSLLNKCLFLLSLYRSNSLENSSKEWIDFFKELTHVSIVSLQ
ncbi:hypothetical protein [Kallipyga gabonensis]|uniref:hypothetical protein n=1 Tax=Kallipyga gabonensis TaxID=1686287 RepID=UPI0012B8C8C8|nr:hypothetical protein [Kallipyga gabonensis]